MLSHTLAVGIGTFQLVLRSTLALVFGSFSGEILMLFGSRFGIVLGGDSDAFNRVLGIRLRLRLRFCPRLRPRPRPSLVGISLKPMTLNFKR